MLHVMPRAREGQRTKGTKEVLGARITHTSNNNAAAAEKQVCYMPRNAT